MDIFESARLVFREFERSDIDKLFLLLSNPTVMKFCSGPLDIIGTQRWLDAVIVSYKKYGYDYWAVYKKSTDDFIGQIGIMNLEIDEKQVDCLAFMIDPGYWNKGYATEGSIACIKHAFKSLNLESLVATVEPENSQSISVLTKVGMKFAGETNFANKKVNRYLINNNDFRALPGGGL